MTPRDQAIPLAPRFALTRRSLLLGTGAVALLAACGSDDKADTEGATTTTAAGAGDVPGLILFPNVAPDFVAAGIEQRVPLILLDAGEGRPLTDPPATLAVDVLYVGAGGNPPQQVGETIEVEFHDEGIPQGYYPLRFTPGETGNYLLRTTVDGEEIDSSLAPPMTAAPSSEIALPQVGDPMRPVDTPTVDDHQGVEPYCTLDPPCPLHEVTVTEALAAGGPVALLVSTPAFCQTQICGPVLDLLIEESQGRELTAIHAEVYTDAAALDGDIQAATLSPAIVTYGMDQVGYEPALFIGGADGNLADRLDFTYDATELRAGLDQVS